MDRGQQDENDRKSQVSSSCLLHFVHHRSIQLICPDLWNLDQPFNANNTGDEMRSTSCQEGGIGVPQTTYPIRIDLYGNGSLQQCHVHINPILIVDFGNYAVKTP